LVSAAKFIVVLRKSLLEINWVLLCGGGFCSAGCCYVTW